MRRIVVPGIVIALAAGAFVVGGGGAAPPAAAAELETFPDCPALRERLVATALEHVGPHGLDGTPMPMPFMAVEDTVAGGTDGDVARASTAQGAAESAPGEDSGYTSETGTNVQVVGVDEPDHVKLADDTLALVDGQRVVLVDVSDTTPRQTAQLDLSGELSPFTMLAAGDRLLVFGHPLEPLVEPGSDVDASFRGEATDAIAPWIPPGTVVVAVDVSDRSAPRLVHRMELPAAFVSARLTDGEVLLVTSAGPTIPFVFPSDGPGAEERAEAANRDAVRQATIDQWLPTVRFEDGASRLLPDCDAVGVPAEPLSWRSVTIAAFDPAGDLRDVRAAGTFGAGDTVYAARDRVYVAGAHWDQDLEAERTAIHAFTTGAPPRYLASGAVGGRLLNQFAMDRYEDHLRVATTVTETSEVTRGGTDNRVVVLAEEGGELVAVGEVTGLGRPGETIRGVRYLGPVGFVVTFEQTDPLYTVDLDDPRQPRVLGELKVPGYSAYLHPTGEGELLGVGSAAEDDGRITGVQVSLFDVSDLAAPIRRGVLEIPGVSTPIEWDHHAFTWVGDARVAVVPFEGHGGMVDRPGGAAAPHNGGGILLVSVKEGQIATIAAVGGPEADGWSPGFSRALAHDGSLLAVAPGAVWRIGLDGEVLAETDLSG